MNYVKKNKKFGVVDFTILALLLTSGGGIIKSIFILVFAAGLLLYKRKQISMKNLSVSIIFSLFLVINTIFGAGGDIDYKNFIILLLRIVCILIITSNITFTEFKFTYLRIMKILSLISLVFFLILILFPGINLPGSIVKDGIIGTFYHVMGFAQGSRVITRNCGLFWEPGVYQIYLNFALILLVSDKHIDTKVRNKLFMIFSITLFTTFSTMGYISFIIIILIEILSLKNKNKFKVIAILFFIVFIIIESTTGIISNKLINNQGSFNSRYDDSFISLTIAKEYPIIGTGIIRDYDKIWGKYENSIDRLQYGKLARSNGLGTCLFTMGVPFTAIYLLMIFKFYKRLFKKNMIGYMFAFIANLLFFINEPIMFVPFWLAFFFKWRTNIFTTN